jgi:hypothetical protein
MEAQRQEQLGRRSKLYLGSSKSKTSLRTTVPNVYVDICGMSNKDELEWSHEKINGECILRVKVVRGKDSK